MERVKLEACIKTIDSILCSLKLSRAEHEAVHNQFKLIVDLAHIGLTHKESNTEVERLITGKMKLPK